MNWRLLSVLTVAALSLTAGCNDLVVGHWEARVNSTIDLDIEPNGAGYKGDGHIHWCEDGDCLLCPFELVASSGGSGHFVMAGRTSDYCDGRTFEGVPCLVDGDELRCQFSAEMVLYDRAD